MNKNIIAGANLMAFELMRNKREICHKKERKLAKLFRLKEKICRIDKVN